MPTMLTSETPTTIDEAELQGWAGLETDCAGCRVLTVLFWDVVRKRTRRRRLGEIAARLVCGKCGRRPGRVSLYAPTGGHAPSRRQALLTRDRPDTAL